MVALERRGLCFLCGGKHLALSSLFSPYGLASKCVYAITILKVPGNKTHHVFHPAFGAEMGLNSTEASISLAVLNGTYFSSELRSL